MFIKMNEFISLNVKLRNEQRNLLSETSGNLVYFIVQFKEPIQCVFPRGTEKGSARPDKQKSIQNKPKS